MSLELKAILFLLPHIRKKQQLAVSVLEMTVFLYAVSPTYDLGVSSRYNPKVYSIHCPVPYIFTWAVV